MMSQRWRILKALLLWLNLALKTDWSHSASDYAHSHTRCCGWFSGQFVSFFLPLVKFLALFFTDFLPPDQLTRKLYLIVLSHNKS